MRYSACIDMLFVPESADPAQRIRLAKAAGFDAVEFWLWSNKDLNAIEDGLDETGLTLAGMVAEPFCELTRTSDHQRFFDGLAQSRDVALRLGAKMLIAQSGPELPGLSRASQHDALLAAMAGSADVLKGSGVRLGLEPLNTRIDHKGYYLASTSEGLDIVNAVDRPEIGLTYDLYHSMVMDEVPRQVMAGHVERIVHLHLADHPGRNQPGSGGLDLASAIKWLEAEGYNGFAGLEYRPTGDTVRSFEQTKIAFQ